MDHAFCFLAVAAGTARCFGVPAGPVSLPGGASLYVSAAASSRPLPVASSRLRLLPLFRVQPGFVPVGGQQPTTRDRHLGEPADAVPAKHSASPAPANTGSREFLQKVLSSSGNASRGTSRDEIGMQMATTKLQKNRGGNVFSVLFSRGSASSQTQTIHNHLQKHIKHKMGSEQQLMFIFKGAVAQHTCTLVSSVSLSWAESNLLSSCLDRLNLSDLPYFTEAGDRGARAHVQGGAGWRRGRREVKLHHEALQKQVRAQPQLHARYVSNDFVLSLVSTSWHCSWEQNSTGRCNFSF